MTNNKSVIVFILILTTATTIMSTDIYTPSLPELATIFQTSPAVISLTVSLATLAFGSAMLIYGPLADTLGRRPVLLYGMAAFTVFSMGCSLANSAQLLIFGRILQSAGAAVEGVVVLAIIKDLFDEKEGVKVLGLYGMSVALAPAIAPILGGYIHTLWGWQYNFWLLAFLGLIITGLIFHYIPESGQRNHKSLKLGRSLLIYMSLLSNRRYMRYALCLSIYFAALWAFIVSGPFILIDMLGVKTEHFGYYQAVVVLAFIVGSSIANRGADKLSLEGLVYIAFIAGLLGSITFVAIAALGWIHPWTVILAVSMIVFGLGPLFAVAPLKAMSELTSDSGSAAALLGALEMLISSVAVFLVGTFHNQTLWPTTMVMSVCVLLAAACYFLLKPKIERRA